MKYLVLTGRFGMGHIVAATAIKELLEKSDGQNEVCVVDTLEALLPRSSGGIYKIYGKIMGKCINLYNVIYHGTERFRDVKLPAKRYVAARVGKILTQHKPDIVISTQPLSSKFVATYKAVSGSKLPLITCVTDVHAHPEWICQNTDAYFVPIDRTKAEMVEAGLREEIIFPTGMPVREQFRERAGTVPKRKSRKQVLVMGGGIGLLPKKRHILKALASLEGIDVTIITGKNKKMYHYLKKKYHKMEVLYYTDQMEQYMQRADLIVTKPGGVTMFEAIHIGVPLFVVAPFMGQEAFNAQYIKEKQLGVVITDKRPDYVQELSACLHHEEKLEKMRQSMAAIRQEQPECQIPNIVKLLSERGGGQCL